MQRHGNFSCCLYNISLVICYVTEPLSECEQHSPSGIEWANWLRGFCQEESKPVGGITSERPPSLSWRRCHSDYSPSQAPYCWCSRPWISKVSWGWWYLALSPDSTQLQSSCFLWETASCLKQLEAGWSLGTRLNDTSVVIGGLLVIAVCVIQALWWPTGKGLCSFFHTGLDRSQSKVRAILLWVT